MVDDKLKKYYDEIYKKGKRDKHFLKYRDGIEIPLDHKVANEWISEHKNFNFTSAMDFGCGDIPTSITAKPGVIPCFSFMLSTYLFTLLRRVCENFFPSIISFIIFLDFLK